MATRGRRGVKEPQDKTRESSIDDELPSGCVTGGECAKCPLGESDREGERKRKGEQREENKK